MGLSERFHVALQYDQEFGAVVKHHHHPKGFPTPHLAAISGSMKHLQKEDHLTQLGIQGKYLCQPSRPVSLGSWLNSTQKVCDILWAKHSYIIYLMLFD